MSDNDKISIIKFLKGLEITLEKTECLFCSEKSYIGCQRCLVWRLINHLQVKQGELMGELENDNKN